MRIVNILLFLIISTAASAQVWQLNNSPFNFRNGLRTDTLFIPARGCDTVGLATVRYGSSTTGAIYVDTCNKVLYVKMLQGWQAVGLGDTVAVAPIIDSTGNASFRILYAKDGKIVGDSSLAFSESLKALIVKRIVFNESIVGGRYFSWDMQDIGDFNTNDQTGLNVVLYDKSSGEFVITSNFIGTDSTIFQTIYRADTAKNNLRAEIAGKVDSITREADSVFQWRGGVPSFAFVDSTGGGIDSTAFNTLQKLNDSTAVWQRPNGTADTLVIVADGLIGGGGSIIAVDTIYRKPGVDSIFYKIAGIERAVKDSVGGGGISYVAGNGIQFVVDTINLSTYDDGKLSLIIPSNLQDISGYQILDKRRITLFAGDPGGESEIAGIELDNFGALSLYTRGPFGDNVGEYFDYDADLIIKKVQVDGLDFTAQSQLKLTVVDSNDDMEFGAVYIGAPVIRFFKDLGTTPYFFPPASTLDNYHFLIINKTTGVVKTLEHDFYKPKSGTPTGTADPQGEVGDELFDNNYRYIKTNAGWKRTALETF